MHRNEPPTAATGANRLAEHWTNHRAAVVRYAGHLLGGDWGAAEDVAQETVIRLWQHPEVLDDSRSLAGWLRTVAHNIVVDRYRRRRARPAETALTPGVDREGPDDLGHVESAAAVTTMISGLSPCHRAVVLRVYCQDRPVTDVAHDLGIPAGTVKSRCHHALTRLRATQRPADD